MNPIPGYDNAKVYTGAQHLPVGAYIVGIMDAEVANYDWGDVLVLKFDICEGDYKNFYTEQYRNSQLEDKKYKGNFRMTIAKGDGTDKDNQTLSIFKTNMTEIEESNPGYKWEWDETTLKGKKVGMIFQEREWSFNNKTGWTAQPYCLKSIKAIEDGKYKIPDPKPLANKQGADFSEIPDNGDFPF